MHTHALEDLRARETAHTCASTDTHQKHAYTHIQNPYPALTSKRREMNTQTHIITQTSERGMRE